MYKALYTFNSTNENALSFVEGTKFTLIDSNKDPHWWLVQNGSGQVGFVPANYLHQDESTFADVIKSIDRAIDTLKETIEAKDALGADTEQQTSNLQKLLKHKRNVTEEQVKSHDITIHKRTSYSDDTKNNKSTAAPKRAAPPPPEPTKHLEIKSFSSNHHKSHVVERETENTSSIHQVQHNNESSKNKTADARILPSSSPSQHKNESLSQQIQCVPVASKKVEDNQNALIKDVSIPKEIGSELVEKLRNTAGLSYKASIEAVCTVIGHVRERVPELHGYMTKILETVYVETQNSNADLTTDDAKRLEHIFEELAECKDDSQQRSWFLHEDEHIIQNHLEELLSILNGANTDLCNAIIARDHYSAVDTLVVYYQMETRLNLRMLLLQVFGTLCGLSAKIISELLNSVLPCELARDIQTDTQEMQKFRYSALVLAMIFSQGEPVPLQYYTQLSNSFVEYLLDNIENPPESDDGGQVPDLLLNVALAFNLHFEIPEENTIMKVIAQRGTAKVLTEKLMLLINRGDDPVRMFEHEPKPSNAVLKFLSDLYSSASTSNLLYTNDAKVLIDIVLRMLTDLSPGESLRTEYLSIMELILKNHSYSEHFHRRAEFETCFKKIYNEEEPSCDMDKRIVVQIWKDLPDMFESDCV